MRFSVASSIATLAVSSALVSAQKTIMVQVGANATLTYSPASFTAEVGDIVTFVFNSKNHTITQSLFPTPCEQFINTTDPNAVPVDSKFQPVAANASTLPTYSLQVMSKAPMWFFCAQPGHCAKGMVGAINAPTTGNTFEAFQAKAMASSANTTATPSGSAAPGGASASATGGSPSASGGASATGSASGTGASASGTAPAGSGAGAALNLPSAAISSAVLSMVGIALGLML